MTLLRLGTAFGAVLAALTVFGVLAFSSLGSGQSAQAAPAGKVEILSPHGKLHKPVGPNLGQRECRPGSPLEPRRLLGGCRVAVPALDADIDVNGHHTNRDSDGRYRGNEHADPHRYVARYRRN